MAQGTKSFSWNQAEIAFEKFSLKKEESFWKVNRKIKEEKNPKAVGTERHNTDSCLFKYLVSSSSFRLGELSNS